IAYQKQFTTLQKSQAQWQQAENLLAQLAKTQPEDIRLFTIHCKQTSCKIAGFARTLSDAMLYQKNLQQVGYQTTLSHFKPTQNDQTTN
ncbi:PilN domain-containing protein, partial [Acinetobacter baumannii]